MRRLVTRELERKLYEMRVQGIRPDVLTFAGNGEPTSHPHFDGVIDDVIKVRDEMCPNAKISVLSNATFVSHKRVRDALMKIDNNIQKLDTVNPRYIKLVNRPVTPHYNVGKVIENLKLFNGHVIIQTMFMTGKTENGDSVDNTGDEYVLPWLKALTEIKPQSVMIYTIARDTPDVHLAKAAPRVLNGIRDMVEALGIPCSASY